MAIFRFLLYSCGAYSLNSSKLISISPQEVFGHIELVKILVILNPTGYMLTSSDFAFIQSRYIL